MITWGRFRADLSNLSNGVFYYPILILFAWFTYDSVFKESEDSNLHVVAPMLAVFAGSLASIATERQDKIADRISIELGGTRARLVVRMLSLFIVNTVIVLFGLAVSYTEHGNLGSSAGRTLATSITVTVTVSTLGLLVASFIPHPLVALGLTFALMSWGGPDPDTNWGLAQLLGMLNAETIEVWSKFALSFITPWFLGAAALLIYTALRNKYGNLMPPRPSKRKSPQIPGWVAAKRSFSMTAFRAAITNPIPILALVFCLGLYSYGTVNLAAKLSTIAPGVAVFQMLPGLLFANAIPGLLLAGTSQKRETLDQESLLYKSQRHALASQTLQQTAFVTITLGTYILFLGSILRVNATEPIVIRSLALAVVLSPGLATLGLTLNRIIRLPLVAALVSYLLTLPEIFLARWVPESRPYLPSSLFSVLVGGEGSYAQSIQPLAAIISYALGASLALLPLIAFFKVVKTPKGLRLVLRD